ncbi:Clp protease N-terminal domain-containing protein [Occallatibacter savannae]|uniref:Clp protease N-terminal domain-containing protein n=1 Tax=Occallatibacter savannae TaxID=1002691 RepID=UPI000D69F1B6|nr:Clp protease N-terminal domain-containing protein [Occallatibacter savannae]
MFERFSENARRAVFFARAQASAFGAEEITPELLLLGMLQRPALELIRLIHEMDEDGLDRMREQIEAEIPRGNQISLSVDVPVPQELKRVFEYAIEESDTGLKTVQPGHLLIGILREAGCQAAGLLRANGAELEVLRQRMLSER